MESTAKPEGPYREYESACLPEQLAKGDGDPALEELVRHCREEALRVAKRILQDPGEANLVADQVVERLVLPPGSSSERTGVDRISAPRRFRGIALSAARHALRSQKRRRRHEQEACRLRPESTVVDLNEMTMAKEAMAAIATLPLEQQAPIELHFRRGFTYSAIATCLGLARSTVHERVAEGLAALAQTLTRSGDVTVTYYFYDASDPGRALMVRTAEHWSTTRFQSGTNDDKRRRSEPGDRADGAEER